MLGPRVLEELRTMLAGQPEWREVGRRLEVAAPAGHEAEYRPFVFAFSYGLVEQSNDELRAEVGSAFAPKNRLDGVPFPPLLGDVEEDDAAAWQEAVVKLEYPVAISRLEDLLWERRIGPRRDLHARAACDAYLSVSQLETWHAMSRTRAISRALELATLVGDRERVAAAAERSIAFARAINTSGGGAGPALRLSRALIDLNAPRNGLEALLDDTEHRFGADPQVFDALADLRAVLADDPVDIRRKQLHEWRKAAAGGDAVMRVIFLERALELARTHGLAIEADEVRRELQDIRPEQLGLQAVSAQMQLPSKEVDAYIATFVDVVSWHESLRQFGSEPPPGGPDELIEDDLTQEREDFPLLSLFTKSIMGHHTATARLRASDPESRLKLDRAERRAWYARMWSPFAVRALQEIVARHGRPSHEELAAFFATELIGLERGERIARAFELFWDDQPDESAHVLVPRLEAVVREMARRAGLTIIREPIGLEPGGVRTLGTLLLELESELPDPPWPGYLFNLLADPYGLNLRNTLAHGLIPTVRAGDAALLLHVAAHLRVYGVPRKPAVGDNAA